MILLYFRKNIFRFLLAALVLFMLVDIQQKSKSEYDSYNEYDLYDYAVIYVDNNTDDLYEQAHTDKQLYSDRIYSIQNLEGKDDLQNDSDAFMPEYKLTQSDMAWINTQYNKPGEVSPTVYYDSILLDVITEEYLPRWNLASVIENEIKLDRRNLHRYQPTEYDYKLSEVRLAAAEGIDIGYSDNAPSFGVSFYLPRFEGDLFIVLLVMLLSFTMFSKLRENGYLKYTATAKQGISRFAIKQYAAGILLVLAAFIIYTAGHIIYAVMYLPELSILSAPIQIINGYQSFVYPLTVGEYILLSVLVKLLFMLLVYSLTSFISLVSQNSIISFIANLLLAAVIWFLPALSDSAAIKGLFSGNIGVLSAEQYVNLFGAPVFAPIVLITVYIMFIVIIAAVIGLFGKQLCRNGN